MTKKQQKSKWWQPLRQAFSPFVVALFLSMGLHVSTRIGTHYLPSNQPKKIASRQKPVQIKFTTAQKPHKSTPRSKKISETPLPQTKPPDPEQARWGKQNHRTERETRVRTTQTPKAADAVTKSSSTQKSSASQVTVAAVQKISSKKPTPPKAPARKLSISSRTLTQKNSTVQIQAKPHKRQKNQKYKPRNPYEALLSGAVAQMNDVAQSGYQEALDRKIDLGEAIDINTSHYRYIGYFSSMRKAIEMVWSYPRTEAQKGHNGNVGLQFTIRKDGRVQKVRVTESSGHAMLDKAIVQAIRQAAPFSPLPEGFGKQKLVVMGTFRYVLGY
ncbi:MAG: energy transducer TonB [Oligoflexales bacterium]